MFDKFIRSNPLVFGALRGGLIAAAVCNGGLMLKGDTNEIGKFAMCFVAGAMTSTPREQMKEGA